MRSYFEEESPGSEEERIRQGLGGDPDQALLKVLDQCLVCTGRRPMNAPESKQAIKARGRKHLKA